MRDTSKPSQAVTWIALFLLVCLISTTSASAPFKTQASAQAIEKTSADLRSLLASTSSNERITVIIQPQGKWTSVLDLVLKNLDALTVLKFRNFNARVVMLPAKAVAQLARRSDIRYISPDRPTISSGHISTTTGADLVRQQTTFFLGIPTTTTLDGTGIGIAILDSGIDAGHQMFKNASGASRIVVNQDFTGEGRTDDPYGHGTHVASAAAGNSDIAQGAYTGIAPNAKIFNLRVLDSNGTGTTSGLLAALDWVQTYHGIYNIRVVNLSLGTLAIESYSNDPLCQAVRRLVDAGIVVVAAAGNNGKDSAGQKIYGHIHSPGNEPSAITIGASNTFGTNARSDDVVTTYSSRGPTRSYWTDAEGVKHYDNLIKPDLVAPGNRVVWAEARNNLLVTEHPELDAQVSMDVRERMMYLSGTSMATPVAAGACALLLQANPSLSPNLVKMILQYTAQPLSGYNTLEQGTGQLNIEGAVRLAKLVRTDLSLPTAILVPVGDQLLTGAAPATETTLAGHTFHWSRGVIFNHTFGTGTNIATRFQKVYLKGLLLGDGVVEDETFALDSSRMTSGIALEQRHPDKRRNMARRRHCFSGHRDAFGQRHPSRRRHSFRRRHPAWRRDTARRRNSFGRCVHHGTVRDDAWR